MKISYKANIMQKDKVVKRQIRQSADWKRLLPVRIFLWLGIPGFTWLMYRYLIEDIFLASMLMVLVWGSIVICFYVITCRYVGSDVSKMAEELNLDEQEITYFYRPAGTDNRYGRVETRIKYSEIRRIEYHPYYQSVKVFAPVYYTVYRDRRTMAVKREGTLQEGNDFRLYYEYIEGFQEFVRELSDRSGIPVTRIDTREKFEKERKLK